MEGKRGEVLGLLWNKLDVEQAEAALFFSPHRGRLSGDE